jgi:hypothetical protein
MNSATCQQQKPGGSNPSSMKAGGQVIFFDVLSHHFVSLQVNGCGIGAWVVCVPVPPTHLFEVLRLRSLCGKGRPTHLLTGGKGVLVLPFIPKLSDYHWRGILSQVLWWSGIAGRQKSRDNGHHGGLRRRFWPVRAETGGLSPQGCSAWAQCSLRTRLGIISVLFYAQAKRGG